MQNFLILLFYIIILARVIYKKPMIDCWRNNIKDTTFLVLSMGALLLLNCLRGAEVGNDTASYKNLFEYYVNGKPLSEVSSEGIQWMDGLDIGFRMFTILFGSICSNYQVYIAFCAIILYGTVILFCKKESDNICISVILFFLLFYHPYINVLRQAMAISILLIGFKRLKKKRNLTFAFYVFLAMTFHRTAAVAFLLIPLARIKKFSLKWTIIILGTITTLTATHAFQNMMSIIGYSGKYLTEEEGISTYAQILLSIISFVLILYWKGKHINILSFEEIFNNGSDMENFYSRISLVHLCLSIAGINLPILFRCSYYFTIFYLTGIPFFVMRSQHPRKMVQYTFAFLIITYVVYQVGIIAFRPDWVTEFQYKFFWQ